MSVRETQCTSPNASELIFGSGRWMQVGDERRAIL